MMLPTELRNREHHAGIGDVRESCDRCLRAAADRIYDRRAGSESRSVNQAEVRCRVAECGPRRRQELARRPHELSGQLFGKRKVVIRNRAAFIGNYSSFLSPKLRASVLAQDPANVFENWQGVMIGGGNQNIWVTKVGDADNAPYQIITINDADPPAGGK
jgi:hypothetical protein